MLTISEMKKLLADDDNQWEVKWFYNPDVGF